MSSDDDGPTSRDEPTTGRPVLSAPSRQRRPKLTHGDDDPSACPFCPGAEAQTPAEIDVVRAPGSPADGPGWRVRAFPNKYPASLHHEVVVEGERHTSQPGELDPSRWAEVVQVWQRRIIALEQRDEVACAFLFKNVGARAGASIVHNHSQLLGLPAVPPRLELERERAEALGRCPWCDAIERAAADQRLIFEGPAHWVIAPPVPRLAHEIWLLPRACEDLFVETDAVALGDALHQTFRAIEVGLDAPALNLWLHRYPGARFHWHFEIQPRMGQLAGLELGADVSINSVPPAASARRLRAGLDQHRSGARARLGRPSL